MPLMQEEVSLPLKTTILSIATPAFSYPMRNVSHWPEKETGEIMIPQIGKLKIGIDTGYR